MECLVPILLERRGAAEVHACDRLDLSERVGLLREHFNTGIIYGCGIELGDLYETLRRDTDPLFDLVVFSGVLYQTLDPLAGLLTARRFVRNGGIVIVECECILSNEGAMHFNVNGQYGMGDNFWLPTAACLDYLLRLCRLKPLDCFYFRTEPEKKTKQKQGRVCIPRLAVSSPPDPDEWLNLPQWCDVGVFLDRAALDEPSESPVAYKQSDDLVFRDEGSVDVMKTIRQTSERLVTDIPEQVQLRLDAKY